MGEKQGYTLIVPSSGWGNVSEMLF